MKRLLLGIGMLFAALCVVEPSAHAMPLEDVGAVEQSIESQNGETDMRNINDHKTNECNSAITLHADEPDAKYGNASHEYHLFIPTGEHSSDEIVLKFQRGPIAEVGTNGVTNEVLLAILIDRLRGFQSGPFSCRENALALTKLEEAKHWFEHRTKARVARGVEGTNVV